MNLRGKQREEPDVNLTPLIDVVFLMLIFFMVSTTFNREAELSIELPSASSEPTEAEEVENIEIVIDAEGRYFINEQAVINSTTETLAAALRKVIGKRDGLPLTISADAKTPHQSVVTAMDAAGQVGLVHISITTKKDAE
ncbi:biopolymer transporter ExbD [Solemya pervernicosa gill symbiont]|uniref:Biopolymer transporter ExbD n=2 Tax=Gammaproteobacteria incertae sedis TaxID=118884 RepID=A0A1T2LAN0_9GAMM|nr:biopolymer transporter ExbD [Candidatus Reidiella endopervernicosa]OOZ42062.1 biopolymer transporter ExbD [Solemya pervernicosa gill symbiont]QKQ26985.1 biopolymer transporter ExbD [Candidatus Reidiella endopervernicosa]